MLERGPVELLELRQAIAPAALESLLAYEDELSRELETAGVELAPQVLEAWAAAHETGDEALASLVLESSLELEAAEGEVEVETFGDALRAAGEVEAELVAASGEIPAEAWQPLPEPLQDAMLYPGFEGEGPALPPGFELPAPPPPGPITRIVRWENLSQPGAAGFAVGQAYLLELEGAPNSLVEVQATHNDNTGPLFGFGLTDERGRWWKSEQIVHTSRGRWRQQWFVGGVPAGAPLVFNVT